MKIRDLTYFGAPNDDRSFVVSYAINYNLLGELIVKELGLPAHHWQFFSFPEIICQVCGEY